LTACQPVFHADVVDRIDPADAYALFDESPMIVLWLRGLQKPVTPIERRRSAFPNRILDFTESCWRRPLYVALRHTKRLAAAKRVTSRQVV
jgi:hypothetical protein|tara:strand:- start:18 stop:290 length:273 start_codon:yes stop_codon:yes gene_type:complete